MGKIGLITFHSAYNFGSVLQAFATQKTVEKITGNCSIINYRTIEQQRVYSIFQWKQGAKSLIKNTLILPSYFEKRNRALKYEHFFEKYYSLTGICKNPEDINCIYDHFDLIISGSDQIWNKNANELNNIDMKYMDPYLLKGYKGEKVSYASSPTNWDDKYLKYIADNIRDYEGVSFRESVYTEYFYKQYGISCCTVLDPTFLLSRQEWIDCFNLQKTDKEPYILYYGLSDYRSLLKVKAVLTNISTKMKMRVVFISPMSFLSYSNDLIIDRSNVDPVEFLYLLLNAKYVITDSYHGSILSINFNKDVYSLCSEGVSNMRKVDILSRLGLNNRVITDIEKLNNIMLDSIHYEEINNHLDTLRTDSINYLKNILCK